jgi:site-specific DNA-methyltransferase (adenine-specific)
MLVNPKDHRGEQFKPAAPGLHPITCCAVIGAGTHFNSNRSAAGYVQTALDGLGLTWRNTIVWRYNFGPHQKGKFGLNHQQLLYYVADSGRFTFNADAVRVPSDRQTKYRDKRANPLGRVPGDVWHFPRVCGTFKRRVDHACQTPDELLDRIVLAYTNPGDLIIDPFAGSGSAGAAALRHGRRYLGCELSPETAEVARRRLAQLTRHLSPQPEGANGAATRPEGAALTDQNWEGGS